MLKISLFFRGISRMYVFSVFKRLTHALGEAGEVQCLQAISDSVSQVTMKRFTQQRIFMAHIEK